MPLNITPSQLHEQVCRSYDRTRVFRKSRLMKLRQFVGAHYNAGRGNIGEEPLNLMYNAARALVPHIVMNFPKFNVESRWAAYGPYAELLGMALTYDAKRKDLQKVYRAVIVDALFTIGTLKTGLADSGTALAFDDWGEEIDPGAVYTERVDFDNLIVDPNCVRLEDAAFLGDRIRVPRSMLLDSGLYDNAQVEALPSVEEQFAAKHESARGLTEAKPTSGASKFMDDVEVAELWVPSAQAIVTVPAAKDIKPQDFLRIDDYYGPDAATGPYTFLQLGLPVSDNPFHVAPTDVWYDLHVLANRMASKIVSQAERQKTVLGYSRNAADDAESVVGAGDGEAIAMDDPDGVREFNFGGQRNSNEAMLAQLQGWFNMMAANPQGVGGQHMDADSATEAQILQTNAQTGLSDMKDQVYQMAAEEGGKRAWYFHVDPFINLPMVKRERQPPLFMPDGTMYAPAEMVERQVVLTPEVRAGDWLDFTFEVEPESMGRIDSTVRLQQAMNFMTRVLPSVATTAQALAMMGIPFSAPRALVRLAREAGIDWLEEAFYDPEFQMMMQAHMARSPTPEGSQAQPGPGPGGAGGASLAALLQNGQPATIPAQPDAMADMRRAQQAPAADAQAMMAIRSQE